MTELLERALVALWSVVASQQLIATAFRAIDLMETTSLRAKCPAISTLKAFKMQNKSAQILRIAGELVLRLRAPAHACHGAANFRGQPLDMLRIQGRVQKVQSTASECR